MAKSDIRPSFAKGELTPSLWGRTDLSQFHIGLSVGRNGFVSYRGGWSSRAGTAFVGQCLQPATPGGSPPRLIRFQFNIKQGYILEFGDGYMRVVANGAYITEAPIALTAATNANPAQITAPGNAYAPGDWIYLSGLTGETPLNGRTFIVASVDGNGDATLNDTFGDPVDTRAYAAYTGGGTAARIYTVDTPYAAVDLAYLKVVQSADVMSLCCVNQETGAEYLPVDLKRLAVNDWQFEPVDFAASIVAPAACIASASTTTTTNPVQYAYCVTAIDAETGEESVPSPVAYITDSVDIALTAGSHTIEWDPVIGAGSYNIYATAASYDTPVPVGTVFGYLGTSYGVQFVNSNILPDETKTPPAHTNPFARGTILSVTMSAQGTGYNQMTTSATVAGGSGAVLIPIVANGNVAAVLVQDGGETYVTGTPITFADSGGGSGASGTIVAGPQTGTYPGVVAYFQQRRFYASTINNPDTLYASQTGAYTNFDASTPPVDSDAITTTPWGQLVNGIQWLESATGGLIAATGQDAWLLSGTAGTGSPITPAQESAARQESNGFSSTVPIIKDAYDFLYVTSFQTAAYDLAYNFFTNAFSGTDITVMSNHLFEDFSITYWAYAKQPFKVIWATRSDGKFLSFTYLKDQQLAAWCRHDTNGIVVGNETVAELPNDVPYFIVKRYILGKRQWAYYLERMDNRLWDSPEDPWCVDCGLALAQPTPAATLTASSASGPGSISGAYVAEGGQGYVAPSAIINDPSGLGTGGAVSLQVAGGAITGVSITPGQGYPASTTLDIIDAAGGGATIVLFVSENVIFTASSAVFGATQPGDIIRMGGGSASVITVTSATQVVASIIAPILKTVPNDPNKLPLPAPAGAWSITNPVTTIANLEHLEGMGVAVLADGAVVAGGDEPLLVVTNGTIILPAPASSIKVGLPFIAQMQTMHADIEGAPTIQGKRKKIIGTTVRMDHTRGIEVGCDQPVASTLPSQQEVPWANMQPVADYADDGVPAAALPLFTGDKHVPLASGWQNWNGSEASPGMICVQQRNPLPVNVTALVPEMEVGDSDG